VTSQWAGLVGSSGVCCACWKQTVPDVRYADSPAKNSLLLPFTLCGQAESSQRCPRLAHTRPEEPGAHQTRRSLQPGATPVRGVGRRGAGACVASFDWSGGPRPASESATVRRPVGTHRPPSPRIADGDAPHAPTQQVPSVGPARVANSAAAPRSAQPGSRRSVRPPGIAQTTIGNAIVQATARIFEVWIFEVWIFEVWIFEVWIF
jgi:hypothetical protein